MSERGPPTSLGNHCRDGSGTRNALAECWRRPLLTRLTKLPPGKRRPSHGARPSGEPIGRLIGGREACTTRVGGRIWRAIWKSRRLGCQAQLSLDCAFAWDPLLLVCGACHSAGISCASMNNPTRGLAGLGSPAYRTHPQDGLAHLALAKCGSRCCRPREMAAKTSPR